MKFVANTADAGAETLIADHRGFGRAILPFVTKAARATAQARARARARYLRCSFAGHKGCDRKSRRELISLAQHNSSAMPLARSVLKRDTPGARRPFYCDTIYDCSDRLPSFPRLAYESLEFTYVAPLRNDDPEFAREKGRQRVSLVARKFAFVLSSSSSFYNSTSSFTLTCNEKDKSVRSGMRRRME